MANPSGRIGREGEHQAVAYLQRAGYETAEREGKRAASLDVVAEKLTIPIEVKRQKNISFPAWMRKMEERHGDRWGHFIIQRDARRKAYPDTLVFPAAFGAELLHHYETCNHGTSPDAIAELARWFMNELNALLERENE